MTVSAGALPTQGGIGNPYYNPANPAQVKAEELWIRALHNMPHQEFRYGLGNYKIFWDASVDLGTILGVGEEVIIHHVKSGGIPKEYKSKIEKLASSNGKFYAQMLLAVRKSEGK